MSLPNLINQSPKCITDKLFIQSLKGLFAKHEYMPYLKTEE